MLNYKLNQCLYLLALCHPHCCSIESSEQYYITIIVVQQEYLSTTDFNWSSLGTWCNYEYWYSPHWFFTSTGSMTLLRASSLPSYNCTLWLWNKLLHCVNFLFVLSQADSPINFRLLVAWPCWEPAHYLATIVHYGYGINYYIVLTFFLFFHRLILQLIFDYW